MSSCSVFGLELPTGTVAKSSELGFTANVAPRPVPVNTTVVGDIGSVETICSIATSLAAIAVGV